MSKSLVSFIVLLISGFSSFYSNALLPASCKIPGYADSYVLAISWQPGFCELNRNKPDCRQLESAFGTTRESDGPRFALHGLWPYQDLCGTNYNCSSVAQPINLSPTTKIMLGKAMPNYDLGYDLYWHEWERHGTCSTFSANKFFQLSVKLFNDFAKNRDFNNYMTNNVGKTVNTNDLISALESAYGAEMVEKMEFVCVGKNNQKVLQEIRIALPSYVDNGQSLYDLAIGASQSGLKIGSCSPKIYIDEWGISPSR